MTEFREFHGTRYNLNKVELDQVVAPPYDVIDESERARLSARSPFNAVHVELPDSSGRSDLSPYENAARLLAKWSTDRVLIRDGTASFYVYQMRFVDDTNRTRTTTGVIGALGIETGSSASIRPHEQTTPKPMGDRLQLLQATRTNLSPIWGLSLAEGLTAACTEATRASKSARAHDDDGVAHEIWQVTDSSLQKIIQEVVESEAIVLADGHHRYQTALTYRDEQRARSNGDVGEDDEFVMAYVVELDEEALSVGPIHRVITGLPTGFALSAAFGDSFDSFSASDDPFVLVREMNERGGIGFLSPQQSAVLVPKSGKGSSSIAELDSSRLDAILRGLPHHEIAYENDPQKCADALRQGKIDAAFLLRPASIEEIARTAREGGRMPPKTTFFHPKPRTGMVFRSLD